VDERRKECLLIHYPLLELASPEALEIISGRFWAEDDRKHPVKQGARACRKNDSQARHRTVVALLELDNR
jgi:hypothetical protein